MDQVKEIVGDDGNGLIHVGSSSPRSMINLYERQVSVSHSSRIYFPSMSQGVPFQWEMQPGTSKDPPENDILPPLTPPPAFHSARLPPRPPSNSSAHDHQWRFTKAEYLSNRWRTWLEKKNRSSRSKKCPNDHDHHESSRFTTDLHHDLCSSSFSSSWASSSSSYFPAAESWDIAKVLGETKEGDKYCICDACKNDMNGFALGKILSRDSSANDESCRMYYRDPEGVAFQWEEQPGKSKEAKVEATIPPPSPPPAMQSQGFPKPIIHDHEISTSNTRVWFWKKKKNQQNKILHKRSISFIDRHNASNLLGTSRGTTASVMHLWSSWKKLRSFGDILGGLIRSKPA